MLKKKILIAIAAGGTALAMLPLFAAFEAHVINVTAKIENALSVPVNEIKFGTVFPQEKLDKTFDVFLSQSFIEEDRVDDVEYFIRQKPKCGLPIPETKPVQYSEFEPAIEDGQGNFTCERVVGTENHVGGYVLLPLLCPYLSKHEISTDGIAPNSENDGGGLNAFHGPIDLASWTLPIAKSFDVKGRLAKSEQDTQDTWNIDLKVPCFGGYCAQDWADFVHEFNSEANPDDYTQPIANEHKTFGCDLWVEVSGISTTTPCEPVTGATVVSDTTNTVTENGGANALAVSFIHQAWTASIPGATWIWEEDGVGNPDNDETFTFVKTFNLTGTVTSAILDIATDNTYSVEINNVATTCLDANANNFQFGTQDSCNVTPYLSAGNNTIEITVTNQGFPGGEQVNPAGLLYKLTYSTACIEE